ncbi:MAG: hypothetical protein ABIJ52_13475 [Pseudomonadota bacterium]|nr:hypothetical protein [Patescibacteria group bacterium]
MQQGLNKGLTHALNVNGYSFQYAILKAAKACLEAKKSPWVFEVSEFPVTVNEIPIHIDFILRNKHEPFFFIGECKRADPALSNWCFVKSPYVSRKISTGERIVRETINADPKIILVVNDPKISLDWIERCPDIYRLAFEVRSNEKGESKGRGQINEAITQALRGMNGLIDFFVKHFIANATFPLMKYQGKWLRASFMPVIFTTAKLWVSDVDLSTANLKDGNIDVSAVKLEPKSWVLYHYAQSPSIKHPVKHLEKSEELSDILYLDYTRTIPIVSSEGLDSFLSSPLWNEPDNWHSYC